MTQAARSAGSAWDADTAVEQLYATHWTAMVRAAVLLLGDRAGAEDVVQDAYVALHRRWGRLRDPEQAAAYLRRSVVNGARSALRHRGVERRHAPALAERGVATDPAEVGVRRDAVLRALAELPRRQREVLVLRHYLDLDEAAIAAELGISRGAVKSHASRGSEALRRRLDRDGGPATPDPEEAP